MAARKKTAKTLAPGDSGISSHAPSARIITTWTPAQIRSAEYAAEQGNLSTAVSICEWLLSDDRVVACLDSRIDALMGLAPTFEPGNGRSAKKVVKALEAGEDWWDAYPESELRQLLRWGILLGAAPARHEWTERPDHAGRALPALMFWHPQTLRFDMQLRRWSVRDSNGIEIFFAPGDGEWVLHTPAGSSRPWAQGLWRSLARWVLVKGLAQSDWARHSEKASVLAITAPDKATKEQRREVADDLYARGADTVIALAAGFDIKMVEVVANTKAIYEAQIEAANTAIAIRIRGSNLTTEVAAGSGSKAATESQAKTGDGAKLKADASALATTLNTQSLVWWAEFNFGDRRLAPWPVWPVEPEEDKAQRATMVKTLGEGLTVWDKLGFDIDPKAVTEEFGLAFITGRSKEREPDPVPGALPGAPEPGEKQTKTPKQRMSSGATLAADSGFVSGQMYADDLVDSGVKFGAGALSGHIDDILAAVDESSDYESLRANVLKRWGQRMQPEQLRTVLAHCLELAELAGHFAAKQDSN
jgi:phage gp29-like protein